MAVEKSHRCVRLLEVNPDLGVDLPPAAFQRASRALTCPVIELGAGDWDPGWSSAWSDIRGRVLGFFVMEGLIVREVSLGGRVCSSLHGPQDLLAGGDCAASPLPLDCRLVVPLSARVAVLDDRFLAAVQRWPWLAGRLFDAAGQQTARASTHQAISQLPRVEDRLVALFWHLADRWGVVRPEGVDLNLPLTHEALGRLVGARRPTVSLGLQQLADRRAVERRDVGGWRLAHDSLDVLARSEPATARRIRLTLGSRPVRVAEPLPQPSPIDVKGLFARLQQARAQTELNRESHQRNLAQNGRARERIVALRGVADPLEPTSLAS